MLKQIVLISTMRCDLKCLHCLRGFSKERPDFPNELLPNLLASAQIYGATNVALTGGEPHLHPHFEEMVEMIIKAGYTWHIVSNGQRTEPYLTLMNRFREQFKFVSLSLDGATPDIHDLIRNRKGAFDKLMKSAKIFQEAGFSIRMNTTLNQLNKNQLREMIQLAKEIGAISIGIGGTNLTAWNGELKFSSFEGIKLWKEINNYRKELDFPVNTYSSLYTQGGVNFCKNLNMRELSFNYKGELIFCCDTTSDGAVVGSLFDYSLPELINKWLSISHELQLDRANVISNGRMGKNFDTCEYCINQLQIN